MTTGSTLPTPLVSADWLADHLDDSDLRVFDATVHLAAPEPGSTEWSQTSGHADYFAAHIPGAAFADIIDDLSEPDGGWFTKPSPERFAAAAGQLGIGPATTVVVYSQAPFWATRLWWLLRANGFDSVAVLDGGIGKWTAEDRPTRSGTESYRAVEFVGTPRPELFAELAEVKAVVDAGTGACLINSLSPEDHHATRRTATRARAGSPAVATSSSAPCSTRPTAPSSRSTSCVRSSPRC